MTSVAISQNDDIGVAVRDALKHFDLPGLLGGKLVAIKPNETWASQDDTTAVTQPDSLRAVIRAVKAAGPREVVVSGGAGDGETETVFRQSGMLAVFESESVAWFDHNRAPFVEVPLADGPVRTV